MTFTALHRALGLAPAPLSDDLLDAAVAAGVVEANDLDWKSELPPAKGLPQTDFSKDVAAMANSGGGVIVFGVRESQKAATERVDVGELDEAYERSLRSAAITTISPPVFGLNVYRLGVEGNRAVVVEVPASIDGPHLIYKNDYFAAPVRNDSDTVWMKERQIEAMYRARFEERRHATEVLDSLYGEAAAGRDSDKRAWLIAVAHPRIPRFRDRLTTPGGEQLHHFRSDPEHLAGLAVGPCGEPDPERSGQVLLHHPLCQGAGGRAVRIDRAGRQRSPDSVGTFGPVEDGVVHMQLRVVVAGVVLQEGGDDPIVGVDVPAGAAAVVPDA